MGKFQDKFQDDEDENENNKPKAAADKVDKGDKKVDKSDNKGDKVDKEKNNDSEPVTVSIREKAAQLSQSQPVKKKKKKKKKKRKNKKNKKPVADALRMIALVICACVFVYSGYTIVTTLMGYSEGRKTYAGISNLFYGEAADGDSSQESVMQPGIPVQDLLLSQETQTDAQGVQRDKQSVTNEMLLRLSGQLDKVRELNNDTYGWLRVMCSADERINTINYVVLQARDNDYYLNRDFYKNHLRAGAIFSDFRISRNIDENLNTIIYGHNMGDNSMFGPLIYFGDNIDSFNAGIIEISTWDGIYLYEVFSVYETHSDSRGSKFNYLSTGFNSEEEYVEFLNELKAKSAFQKSVELTSESRIVTLSTCTNNIRNTRYATHGVLVGVVKPIE